MSDHQDLAPYPGQIEAVLEAAASALDSINLAAHQDDDERRRTRANVERAIWLVWAARTITEQLCHETNLR